MPSKKSEAGKDIQKRTVTIPPTKVSKDLIQEIGNFLETKDTLKLTYSVNSKTKEVKKHKINEFTKSEWGEELRKLQIKSRSAINIDFNFRYPRLSEYSVYGKKRTWVNGMEQTLGEIFQKHKVGYSLIKTNWLVKLAIPIILAIVLTYPLFLFLNDVLSNVLLVNPAGLLAIGIVFVLVFVLFYFVQWLFPYFELEGTPHKSIRKWISWVLFGSGLLTSILLHYLGF